MRFFVVRLRSRPRVAMRRRMVMRSSRGTRRMIVGMRRMLVVSALLLFLFWRTRCRISFGDPLLFRRTSMGASARSSRRLTRAFLRIWRVVRIRILRVRRRPLMMVTPFRWRSTFLFIRLRRIGLSRVWSRWRSSDRNPKKGLSRMAVVWYWSRR